MTHPKNVNLDELIGAQRTVTLDGKRIPIVPVDGVSYQLMVAARKEGEEAVLLAMYEVAKQCLPSLSAARIMKLSARQVGGAMAAASEGVERVEALASPNSAPAGVREMSPTPS